MPHKCHEYKKVMKTRMCLEGPMQNICIIERSRARHTKSWAPMCKSRDNARVFGGPMCISTKTTHVVEGPMQNVFIFTSKMTACVSPKWLWVKWFRVYLRMVFSSFLGFLTALPKVTLSALVQCFWTHKWAQNDFKCTLHGFLKLSRVFLQGVYFPLGGLYFLRFPLWKYGGLDSASSANGCAR